MTMKRPKSAAAARRAYFIVLLLSRAGGGAGRLDMLRLPSVPRGLWVNGFPATGAERRSRGDLSPQLSQYGLAPIPSFLDSVLSRGARPLSPLEACGGVEGLADRTPARPHRTDQVRRAETGRRK